MKKEKARFVSMYDLNFFLFARMGKTVGKTNRRVYKEMQILIDYRGGRLRVRLAEPGNNDPEYGTSSEAYARGVLFGIRDQVERLVKAEGWELFDTFVSPQLKPSQLKEWEK